MFEVGASLGCAINVLLCEGPVIGMYALHHHVQNRFRAAIVFEDAIGFLRPDNLSAFGFPAKAACMTEPLRFGQVGFSPSEFLSQKLVLRNVYGCADDSLKLAILNDGITHAANVPKLTAWSHDALDYVTSRGFRNHSLDFRCHRVSVLRMDPCQYFLKCGCRMGRIKTEYLK